MEYKALNKIESEIVDEPIMERGCVYYIWIGIINNEVYKKSYINKKLKYNQN